MSSFYFVLDSDTHYGVNNKTLPFPRKQYNPEIISNLDNIDFVIVAGDLTENGYDNSKFLCFHYGGWGNQLKAFKENYVDYIENAGIPVKLCIGNHDRGRNILGMYLYQPVFSYVKRRHSGIKYSFDHKGVRFICCGKYPKNLKWLKKQLQDLTEEEPVIIYFHYNLVGKWSDWWKDEEKEAFYDVIKDYNIQAILVGHRHINLNSFWKQINVISAANSGVGIIKIINGKYFSTRFKKS